MCGFATNLPVFLAGRALTGLGGGLLVVMLYVIAGRVYPEAIRPRLFTYVSAAWVLPSLLGAPLSAWLTTNLIVALGVLGGGAAGAASPWPPSPTPATRIDDSALTAAVSSRDHSAHVRAAWAGWGSPCPPAPSSSARYELVLELSPRTGIVVAGLVGVVVFAPMLVPRRHLADGARAARA